MTQSWVDPVWTQPWCFAKPRDEKQKARGQTMCAEKFPDTLRNPRHFSSPHSFSLPSFFLLHPWSPFPPCLPPCLFSLTLFSFPSPLLSFHKLSLNTVCARPTAQAPGYKMTKRQTRLEGAPSSVAAGRKQSLGMVPSEEVRAGTPRRPGEGRTNSASGTPERLPRGGGI